MSGAVREPYEPPQVRRVRLAADELAVAACKKQQIGTTPEGPICRNGGLVTIKNIGS